MRSNVDPRRQSKELRSRMGCDSIRLNPANSFDGKFERSVVA
jgi:hypothetical protein